MQTIFFCIFLKIYWYKEVLSMFFIISQHIYISIIDFWENMHTIHIKQQESFIVYLSTVIGQIISSKDYGSSK